MMCLGAVNGRISILVGRDQADISVPGARAAAGIVGIGHQGNGTGLRWSLPKNLPIILIDIAALSYPGTSQPITTLYRHHTGITKKGVGDNLPLRQTIGPDVVDASGFRLEPVGEYHIDAGRVIIPLLGQGVTGRNNTLHFPA